MWQTGDGSGDLAGELYGGTGAVENFGDESGCQALCEAVGAPAYNYMTQLPLRRGGTGCRCYSAAQAAAISPGGSGWTFCTGSPPVGGNHVATQPQSLVFLLNDVHVTS